MPAGASGTMFQLPQRWGSVFRLGKVRHERFPIIQCVLVGVAFRGALVRTSGSSERTSCSRITNASEPPRRRVVSAFSRTVKSSAERIFSASSRDIPGARVIKEKMASTAGMIPDVIALNLGDNREFNSVENLDSERARLKPAGVVVEEGEYVCGGDRPSGNASEGRNAVAPMEEPGL